MTARIRVRKAQIIAWEEPPPSRMGRRPRDTPSEWEPIADQLRTNPGRWAVVYEGPRGGAGGLAWLIRRGALDGFDFPGDFEACIRGTAQATRTYVRYVGGWED